MNLKRFAWFVLLAAQAGLWGGCATSLVWQEDQFARHHEPASPPNLRLFYSSQTRDVLVEYVDLRDSDAATKRRAFWLEPNAERLSAHRRPHFVSPAKDKGLLPIKLRAEPPGIKETSSPEDLCAVASTDGCSFTLYGGNKALGDYNLPKYEDASGRVKQVLLTPPALVVDATIVGGVVAAIAGYFWLESVGGTYDPGRWWR